MHNVSRTYFNVRDIFWNCRQQRKMVILANFYPQKSEEKKQELLRCKKAVKGFVINQVIK